jgi:hypothetical protein
MYAIPELYPNSILSDPSTWPGSSTACWLESRLSKTGTTVWHIIGSLRTFRNLRIGSNLAPPPQKRVRWCPEPSARSASCQFPIGDVLLLAEVETVLVFDSICIFRERYRFGIHVGRRHLGWKVAPSQTNIAGNACRWPIVELKGAVHFGLSVGFP